MNTNDCRRVSAHHRRPGTLSILTGSTAILAGLLLALSVAVPVLADAGLVKSSPEDKAVVTTPPTDIRLTFNEGLDPARSSFKLVRDGTTIGTGKVTAASSKVLALEGLTLAPGGYEVRWTAGSTDGHLVRGTLIFTVADPTPAPAAAEPSSIATVAPNVAPTAASAPLPTPAPTPTPTPMPMPTTGGEGATPVATSSADVLVPIVVGLVAVAGIGALVLRRSRGA